MNNMATTTPSAKTATCTITETIKATPNLNYIWMPMPDGQTQCKFSFEVFDVYIEIGMTI